MQRAISYFLNEITDYKIIVNLLQLTPAADVAFNQAKTAIEKIRINFAPGDSLIEATYTPQLDSLVRIIKKIDHYLLIVKGYSDSLANMAFNQKLSQSRVKAVSDYLRLQNIPATRLKSEFFGNSNPVAPNITSEGRAQNRRVEFVLIQER